MQDLISRDALIANEFKNPISYKAFVNLVKRQPTVDAVPVIRCKDCKFHHDRTRCEKRIGFWFNDDYCNGAVRMDEE